MAQTVFIASSRFQPPLWNVYICRMIDISP
jgi:hypothetical protein